MHDRYMMDGHKLLWHLEKVLAWKRGERIAPVHIDVGLSKGCNIKCEYCFGALQGNVYKKGRDVYFPREPLLRYVRDAGEIGVDSMAFIGEGEPLLNPHVYDAIVVAKKAGVDVALGTNGILFDTGEKGVRALECLSWIRFNISAASYESYKRIHRSDKFNDAVKKISFCVNIKHRRNIDVTIGMQMVLTPSNVDQVIDLAKLGRNLGVDYFVIKQCSDTVANDLGVYGKLEEYDRYRAVLSDAEALGTDSYDVIVKWKKVMNKGEKSYDRCLGAPFLLYSSGDGRIYPCGMFFNYMEDEYRMGDLVASSFKEIFESDRYWSVIKKVTNIDVRNCYANCRTHCINDFLWQLQHPPEHVNFV